MDGDLEKDSVSSSTLVEALLIVPLLQTKRADNASLPLSSLMVQVSKRAEPKI